MDLSQRGTADGTATITHGLTQVLVSVFGPREAKMRSQTLHDRAILNVEVNIAPFSTGERRKKESWRQVSPTLILRGVVLVSMCLLV